GQEPHLRRRRLLAAAALKPRNLHETSISVVEISAVRDHPGTERVDEGIGFALVNVMRIFQLHARWQLRDTHFDLYRLIFGKAQVHQLERAADHKYGSHGSDDQRDLLPR